MASLMASEEVGSRRDEWVARASRGEEEGEHAKENDQSELEKGG
jgi:hypothetical protein